MVVIVILTYNKGVLVREAISRCLDAGYPGDRLLVVDNGSRPPLGDTLRRTYPGLWCAPLKANCGYAGGVNAGLRLAFAHGAQAVYFLSNDVAISAGAVEACEQVMGQTGAGLVAPAVLSWRHGELNSLGGCFNPETLQLSHNQNWDLPSLMSPLDYVPGSSFLIARETFERIGGMDETYFAYWEDVDFSFRAHAAGIRLARCPTARVRHRGRATCGGKHRYTTYFYWRNRIRFCRQHLHGATWNRAQKQLFEELSQLALKWESRGDSARLAYLSDLRRELAIGAGR